MAARRRLSDKLLHIDAALDGKSDVPTGRARAETFDDIRFIPRTLPEVSYEDVDLSMKFLGKTIAAPVMVSPMTGGLKRGGDLNRRMAKAAQKAQIPFGVGSQRVALEVKKRAKDFQVRDVAPTIPIFANLGAVQLVKGYGPDDAERAIEMIEGDALYLHLNAMQEVVQEGGDTDWRGVLRAIEGVCKHFKKHGLGPVYAREVGFGIARDDVRRLLDVGIEGLDCAGAGGTSWTLVEGRVATGAFHQKLGDTFKAWGLTTPEAIREARLVRRRMPLVASGGVRSGLDVARSVALGATVAGMASPVLRAAAKSERAVNEFLRVTIAEVRATLFGVGAKDLASFRREPRIME